jgi:hypothetical protein
MLVSIVGLVAFQPPVLLAPSPRSAAAALAVRMAAPVEEKEKQSFGQKLWSINVSAAERNCRLARSR